MGAFYRKKKGWSKARRIGRAAAVTPTPPSGGFSAAP
jgi:hypothetical protein